MPNKTFVIRYQEKERVYDVLWYDQNSDFAFDSFRNSFVGNDFDNVSWVKVYPVPTIPEISWISVVEM